MIWIYLLVGLAGAAACIAAIIHGARGLFDDDPAARRPSVLAMPGLLVFDLAALMAPVALVGVVPRFTSMFMEMGAELPVLTRIVLDASTVFRGFFGLILHLLIAAGLVGGTHLIMTKMPPKLGVGVLLLGGLGAFAIGAGILVGLYMPLFAVAGAVE